ncbi:MAG: flagellar export chaperone FliS [Patescibacteria group bacterium]|nr:flagellar export chaperone FliS [Patescibacteria group bacterium]
MDVSVRDRYLNAEVMTATPQKLQLMVVEAAIRSCEKARSFWQQDDPGAACEALIHAQACMGELLGALNSDADADLVSKMASVYLFVFQRLIDANNNADEAMLDEALRVLHAERETWRKVCEKLPAGPAVGRGSLNLSSDAPMSMSAPLVDLSGDSGMFDSASAGGFSLEV